MLDLEFNLKTFFVNRVAFPLVAVAWAALLGACAPQGDSPHSRISVYSTAYLTDDNQVVYAVNSGARPKPTPKPSQEWTWTGDGVLGTPSVTIDLGSQTATFFKGDQPVGKSPVSTGREGYGTPTGSFKITQKNKNHVSNLYGDFVNAQGDVLVKNVTFKKDPVPPGGRFAGSPMPFFMRLGRTAVGLHQGFLPGVPDSHGCIRMPERMVKIFFDNAPSGTPVTIID